MGKFECTVLLKDETDVFRAKDLVCGIVHLVAKDNVQLKGVRLYCCGESLTIWADGSFEYVDTETFYSEGIVIFGKRVNEDGPNQTLTKGTHSWPFAFRLPDKALPSSVEGRYGAIRWLLTVEVDMPFPAINSKWYRPFTVLSNTRASLPIMQLPKSDIERVALAKALGIGKAGILCLSVKTDHCGYCPGESIAVTVEAKNDSSKDLGPLTVALVQNMCFHAESSTRRDSQVITSFKTEDRLGKGKTMTLTEWLLPIPAVPASTSKRTSKFISCLYRLKVSVSVPLGKHVEVSVPIAICTVPRDKKPPPPNDSPEREMVDRDPDTVIKYHTCEAGIAIFRKSYGRFPNHPFVPANAFVHNYVYKPVTDAEKAEWARAVEEGTGVPPSCS